MADDLVLAELEALEADDKLDPETVVTQAADPDSPLHDRFEWDDSVAAHKYRLEQARALIRSYTIQVEETEVQVRRFTHVPSQERYVGTERALRDWKDEVMAAARRDMRTFQQKYKRLGKAALTEIAVEVLDES